MTMIMTMAINNDDNDDGRWWMVDDDDDNNDDNDDGNYDDDDDSPGCPGSFSSTAGTPCHTTPRPRTQPSQSPSFLLEDDAKMKT